MVSTEAEKSASLGKAMDEMRDLEVSMWRGMSRTQRAAEYALMFRATIETLVSVEKAHPIEGKDGRKMAMTHLADVLMEGPVQAGFSPKETLALLVMAITMIGQRQGQADDRGRAVEFCDLINEMVLAGMMMRVEKRAAR